MTEKDDEFLDEILSGKKKYDELLAVNDEKIAKEEFYTELKSFSQNDIYKSKPTSFFQSFFTKVEKTNNKYNTRAFKLKQKEKKCFNNGEPVKTASMKICTEIGFFLLATLIVFGVFFSGFAIKDRLITKDIVNLSVDRNYMEERVVVVGLDKNKNTAISVVSTLANWSGKSFSPKLKDDCSYWELNDSLKDALPNYHVTMKEYMNDYDLLVAIYESLKSGIPPVIAMLDTKNEEIVYGVVSSYNANDKKITVKNSAQITETMSVDDFIKITNFEHKDLSIKIQLGLVFGKYQKNVAYFFAPRA